MSDINQPSLPAPFCSVLCVYFCLYGSFNCASFHKSSQQLSIFPLCSSVFISALLVLSSIYLFLKVSFSPDIIPSGWLGTKHQLINWLTPLLPIQLGTTRRQNLANSNRIGGGCEGDIANFNFSQVHKILTKINNILCPFVWLSRSLCIYGANQINHLKATLFSFF